MLLYKLTNVKYASVWPNNRKSFIVQTNSKGNFSIKTKIV